AVEFHESSGNRRIRSADQPWRHSGGGCGGILISAEYRWRGICCCCGNRFGRRVSRYLQVTHEGFCGVLIPSLLRVIEPALCGFFCIIEITHIQLCIGGGAEKRRRLLLCHFFDRREGHKRFLRLLRLKLKLREEQPHVNAIRIQRQEKLQDLKRLCRIAARGHPAVVPKHPRIPSAQ